MQITYSIRARCLISLLVLSLTAGISNCPAQDAPQNGSTIYDPNPQHLWNRLNETLFDRAAPDGKHFGLDELDILYWGTTKNLLVEPSQQRALKVLDDFIKKHGEKLIHDPLKRALLQRDLWELFDWSAKPFRPPEETRASSELQSRLVVLIRRLALTTNEIATLPDNCAQTGKNGPAELPRGLFETNGDWVRVGVYGSSEVPMAPAHVSGFDGRSAFSVMLKMPEGRQAAVAYLEKLRMFKLLEQVWVYRTNQFDWPTNAPHYDLEPNTDVPQFPANTEWALVRRMLVIDAEGRIQPTPITESIQLRRYLKIKSGTQQFFELQLDRRQGGALRALGQNEKGFPFVHFMGSGQDPFQKIDAFGFPRNLPQDSENLQTAVLKTCFNCHNGPGIFSVRSYTGDLSPQPSQMPIDPAPVESAREAAAAIDWKQRQFDWGLLQGLWRQAEKTPPH